MTRPGTASRELVEALERELERLMMREALAYWRMATAAGDEARDEYASARQRLRRFLSQKDVFAEIDSARKSVDPGADEILSRQLDVLYTLFLPNQIPEELIARQVELEAEIEAVHAAFRAEIDGQSFTQNDLDEILRTESDSRLREEAWAASKAVGKEVAPLLEQLVALRNQGARELGFSDYYSLALEAGEIDEEALFTLLDQLEAASRHTYAAQKGRLDHELAKRFDIDPAKLRPWHYSDPFFQEAPPLEIDLEPVFANRDLVRLATSYFDAIGLRLDDVLARSDLFERPGKAEDAFCLDVDAAGDVRILCNLRSTERGARTLFHELGHAVYYLNIATEFPFLLRRPAHILTTEAAALLFERMIYDPHWLQEWTDLSPADAQNIAWKVKAHQDLAQAVFLRWGLVMVHFERSLYRDPNGDLSNRWWSLVERYQGLVRPEQRQRGDWAVKIHLGVAPVYYQNYLLGEVLAAQLYGLVEDELGEGALATSPAAGYVLIDRWFMHGARYPWRELAKRAFGGFDASAYIRRSFRG